MTLQRTTIHPSVVIAAGSGLIDDDAFSIDSAMNTSVDQPWQRPGGYIDEALRRVLYRGA
jgi:hypothetical protein